MPVASGDIARRVGHAGRRRAGGRLPALSPIGSPFAWIAPPSPPRWPWRRAWRRRDACTKDASPNRRRMGRRRPRRKLEIMRDSRLGHLWRLRAGDVDPAALERAGQHRRCSRGGAGACGGPCRGAGAHAGLHGVHPRPGVMPLRPRPARRPTGHAAAGLLGALASSFSLGPMAPCRRLICCGGGSMMARVSLKGHRRTHAGECRGAGADRRKSDPAWSAAALARPGACKTKPPPFDDAFRLAAARSVRGGGATCGGSGAIRSPTGTLERLIRRSPACRPRWA